LQDLFWKVFIELGNSSIENEWMSHFRSHCIRAVQAIVRIFLNISGTVVKFFKSLHTFPGGKVSYIESIA